MLNSEVQKHIIPCKHCGDKCYSDTYKKDDSIFCCLGCKTVYEWLSQEGLQYYYAEPGNDGNRPLSIGIDKYSFLDDPDILGRLIKNKIGDKVRIEFGIPGIHCSSCIYLLENLYKLHPGIEQSRVNFLQKRATIHYDAKVISLRGLVEILHNIGYPPNLSFAEFESTATKSYSKQIFYKIGVAGFCFGNIMLLSFPEYLGLQAGHDFIFISYVNIVLSLPVIFYAGFEFISKAWKQLKSGFLGIDVPIAIGMLTLFIKSLVEILGGTGEGYLDSLSGFTFFLLIGNWFKEYTFKSLSFDKTYTSYFPIGCWKWIKGAWKTSSIDKVQKGDRLLIKNGDLIPCDGILKQGGASIDYQYVTGESKWVQVNEGQHVFAGGRQTGGAIEILVTKAVDQSYLTQLWNESVFKDVQDTSVSKILDQVAKYFTISIISLALLGFAYWSRIDMAKAVEVFTTVLIIACPCVLALSVPFIYGSILRLLKRDGWYAQNAESLESLQNIDLIVFDKTGTLTDADAWDMYYDGPELLPEEKIWIRSACLSSVHPLSKAIFEHYEGIPIASPESFQELPGLGLKAMVNGKHVRLGSSEYIFGTASKQSLQSVFVEVDGKYKGQFSFVHQWREGLKDVFDALLKPYKIAVISGDSSLSEKESIQGLLPDDSIVRFNQKPIDKLKFIEEKQKAGYKVLMIGDGLNDAGALQQSDVGMVITGKDQNFTPSCNVIITADSFQRLPQLLEKVRKSKTILKGAFILAIIYNAVGLLFALQGLLTPIVAAVLMPLSSVSIIVYSFVSTQLYFQWNSTESK